MNFIRMTAAALAGFLMLPGAAAAGDPAADSMAATVSVEQVAIGGPDAPMAIAIWYPANLETRAPGDHPLLPLVIISHGTGAGLTAHVDTARALAQAGFVVAAPMHRGDNFQDQSKVGRPDWMASRSRDVRDVIDHMTMSWAGRAHLKPGRVGIFGFSAGGTGALVSAGGRLDLDRLAPHCATRPEFVCNIIPPAAGERGSAPEWVRDERIAAAVVAAPGLGFLFEPAGLAGVDLPVQLWVGSADDTVPLATNAGIVQRLLPSPPEFHSVEGAAHLSFLAPCTDPPVLCQDPPGFDRAAFHESFNAEVVRFFRQHLGS